MSVSEKRTRHLERVDAMPSGLRQCVHEFGLPIVQSFIDIGVREPQRIRQVVSECWRGARQDGQKSGALNALDFILAQGPVSVPTLKRILADNHMVIVPLHPTRAMVEASMAEVSGGNVICTKQEKHKRRLIAALDVARREAL